MRFCQFYLKDESRDRARAGVQLAGGRIAALADVAPELAGVTRTLDLLERLDAGDLALDALRDRVAALDAGTVATWALDDVRLDAPLTRPPKFFSIAINGRGNWERSIKPDNPQPQYFIKLHTCITGPDSPIELPDIGVVGPEVELAVILGKGGKFIKPENAYDHVFGYTIHNDLTAHGLRARSEWIELKRKDGTKERLTYPGRWKNFDTFSPMGPFLVTRDEVADPHQLTLTADLNGERVQEGSSADVVYRIPELIAYLSEAHTLEVGDIISIGTVPAVEPWKMGTIDMRRYGGEIEVAIEGLGTLRNPIHAI